jgi:hypothetical protein
MKTVLLNRTLNSPTDGCPVYSAGRRGKISKIFPLNHTPESPNRSGSVVPVRLGRRISEHTLAEQGILQQKRFLKTDGCPVYSAGRRGKISKIFPLDHTPKSPNRSGSVVPVRLGRQISEHTLAERGLLQQKRFLKTDGCPACYAGRMGMISKICPLKDTLISPTDGCPACYAGRMGMISKIFPLNHTPESPNRSGSVVPVRLGRRISEPSLAERGTLHRKRFLKTVLLNRTLK